VIQIALDRFSTLHIPINISSSNFSNSMNWGDIISDVKHAADEVVAEHPDLGDDVKHTVEGVGGIIKDHPEVAGEVVKKLEEGGVPDPLGHLPEL
jgi:hypothetical protein